MNALKLASAAVVTALLAIIACSSDQTQAAMTCADGETICGTQCVEAQTDPQNCGGCGTACAAGQVCSQGACSTTCGGGSTQCGSSCVDVKVDAKNCGGCGTTCAAGQVCAAGMCVAQCPSSSQTLCIGDGGAVSCVSTQTDTTNCGGCGNVCDPGKVCSGGTCGDTCGAGEKLCPGPYCAAIQTDNANCGGCGITCTNGQVCSGGACGANCGAGETLCPGGDGGAPYCASTSTDQANCGTCGNACAQGQTCVSGVCKIQCSPGLSICGKECVDLNTNRDHCGNCATSCSGTTPSCWGGVCTKTCVPSGTRQPFNTLASHTSSGCWNGNPCAQGSYTWTSTDGQNFQALNQQIVCSGTTSCVSHVGLTTYDGSSSVCQGAWDVYCDTLKVGNLDTNGKTCGTNAMTNGCSLSFQPVGCSTIKLVATKGSGTTSCCGGSTPDSMITGVSAW